MTHTPFISVYSAGRPGLIDLRVGTSLDGFTQDQDQSILGACLRDDSKTHIRKGNGKNKLSFRF